MPQHPPRHLTDVYKRQVLTRQHNTLADGSAAVTGVLLAMTLPATAPYWLAALGGVFAVVAVKRCV